MGRESKLVTACKTWLQCQKNLGNIVWFARLNSGNVVSAGSYRDRRTGIRKEYKSYMHLCPLGTPDILIITNEGSMLWVEAKSDIGVLRPEQKEFAGMIGKFDVHEYLVIRCVDDLIEFFNT